MEIKQIVKELTLEEKASLCSGSDFWHTQEIERLGIPRVMMCDGPNGLRKQEGEGDHLGINESIKAVCFPTSSAIASSFNRGMARRLGEVLGEECQAENVAMLLGPGVNIKRSPLCGRNFEYYSEDPYLSAEMASAYIKGIQSKDVGACMKHFAANNQETLRMSSDSVLDERTLHEIYLTSFEKAVKEAKPAGVMCSYNKVNGTYLAENKELLTDILRERWGFDGLVVTDWGAVKDRVKGIAAGLDLEMPGGPGAVNNEQKIINAVKNGKLSEEELERSVSAILELVMNYEEQRREKAVFDPRKDYLEAVSAAEESAVLLKNEHQVLPVKKGSRVAFVGEFAERPRYQGNGSSYINSSYVSTPLDTVRKMSEVSYAKGFQIDSEEIDGKLVSEAIEQARGADYAVVFAGLPNTYETEGKDRTHLNLPANQNYIISELCKVQANVIVVLYNGAPVVMPWIGQVSAVLEMYLAGDGVGDATISLLYGDVNPSGKLAETFPLQLSDNPSFLNFPGEEGVVLYNEGIYVGYRYYDKKNMEVLFPFGHGLSYTAFEYSNLQLDKMQITDLESLRVTIDVKNTGGCAGKEVVQLYINDVESTVRRPIRELKGFEKLFLEPGEVKTAEFILDKGAFAYYSVSLHDWYVESGNFLIEIGSSSRDIRAAEEITVESTTKMAVKFSRESTVGQLMHHPKGQAMIARLTAKGGESNNAALGEGSEEMTKAMMADMPLGALVNFGAMSEEQLDGLITMLNAE